MIRYKVSVDVKPLEGLESWLDGQVDITKDIADLVRKRQEPKILSELQDYPPPVKRPIEWTSEKQRKAFFATNGFGHGIPYRRSRHLARSWTVDTSPLRSGVEFRISNTATYARFVVGTLARGKQHLIPMQKFHRNTGWQPASPTVQFWADALQEEFVLEYEKQLGGITQAPTITRSAITPRMGRRK